MWASETFPDGFSCWDEKEKDIPKIIEIRDLKKKKKYEKRSPRHISYCEITRIVKK